MPNVFRILKPIQKSSKRVWVFRNTGANAFTKNQMRLAYEDKRDLYCTKCSLFMIASWTADSNLMIWSIVDLFFLNPLWYTVIEYFSKYQTNLLLTIFSNVLKIQLVSAIGR